MRILKWFPVLSILLLGLAACSSPAAQPDQSDFTWKMEILDTQWSDGLEAVRQSTQYDGTTIETGYEKAPEAGQSFLLLELRVHKDAAGGPAFSWEDVILEASDGEAFPRLPDSFLPDYGYERMAGTDLRLMENQGWVCFQVPKTLKDGSWSLIHSSDEGENWIALT